MCKTIIPAAYFQPWVGGNYWNASLYNRRILILGESHYEWRVGADIPENPEKDLTQTAVRKQTEGLTNAFWTKIAAMLTGKTPSCLTLEDKEKFWHQVAFYNYIQEMLRSRKERLTKEMWKSAEHPFERVLQILKPHFVLMCGSELFDNTPILGGKAGPVIEGAMEGRTWWYPLQNGEQAFAYAVYHPSSPKFKNTAYWHPYIIQAIAMAPENEHH